jgi:hypothetical protein
MTSNSLEDALCERGLTLAPAPTSRKQFHQRLTVAKGRDKIFVGTSHEIWRWLFDIYDKRTLETT